MAEACFCRASEFAAPGASMCWAGRATPMAEPCFCCTSDLALLVWSGPTVARSVEQILAASNKSSPPYHCCLRRHIGFLGDTAVAKCVSPNDHYFFLQPQGWWIEDQYKSDNPDN
jgi:hypothetical protein